MTGIDRLENLPLSELFSGPLMAAIDASVKAQRSTVNLLLDTAYDEEGNLKTVVFTYQSQRENPETGEYESTTRELEIPLVLFLSPPSLQIDEIEQEFSARITSVEERSGETSPGGLTPPFTLGVRPATQSTSFDRRRRSEFDVDVRMRARIDTESAGMDLLDRAVSNSTSDRPPDAEPTGDGRTRITPGDGGLDTDDGSGSDGQGNSPG